MVSIPKLREKWYNETGEKLSEVERYILSLIETDIDSALEIVLGDEFMENSVKEQVKFCMTDDLREAYDHDLAWKEECKRQGLQEGREEGREEGRKEGRAEGQAELIRNMFKNGMSSEEISKMTNISIEKIEDILK